MIRYDSKSGTGAGNSVGANPNAAVASVVSDAKDALDGATGVLGEAAGTAQQALNDVAGEAQKIAHEAGDKAKAFVEENKGRAADQLEGINSALGKAADELEARGQGQLAKYSRDLAGGLDSLTRGINEKSVDELMSSVGEFARSQPTAFLGAAALLGFVSSRFAMSTAKGTSPKPNMTGGDERSAAGSSYPPSDTSPSPATTYSGGN